VAYGYHGQRAADELKGTVDRNLKFRDTYNKVVENSQTAQRNAAAKEMKPDPSTDTPLFNPNSTLAGMGVTIAKKGAQTAVNALTRSDPTRHYGEVARALTEQGATRDARLQSIIDAVAGRQSKPRQLPAWAMPRRLLRLSRDGAVLRVCVMIPSESSADHEGKGRGAEQHERPKLH
jgi:hypothetical protein